MGRWGGVRVGLAVSVAAAAGTVALGGLAYAGVVLAPTTYTSTAAPAATVGTDEAESAVVGTSLYSFGGFNLLQRAYPYQPTSRALVYDSVANRWSAFPAMPVALSHAGITTDGVRYVYYAGGYAPSDSVGDDPFTAQNEVEQVDVTTGAYTALPDLPAARGAGGLALVATRLYYFGGTSSGRTPDEPDVWMLDTANPAAGWTPEAPMPDPRNHMGWGVIGGQVYVAGGMHLAVASTAQPDLDRYDPVAGTWTVLAPLPVARDHVMDSTFVDSSGRLVVVGGWAKSGVSGLVSAYDPVAGTWTGLTPLPVARTSSTARGFADGHFIDTDGSAYSLSPAAGWLARPVH